MVSAVGPGSVRDLTAARELVLAASLGLPTLADGGYDGTGIGMHTPVKQPAGDQMLGVDHRAYTRCHGLRCLGRRGVAVLTGRWRILRHITANPRKIGNIVKAALALTP